MRSVLGSVLLGALSSARCAQFCLMRSVLLGALSSARCAQFCLMAGGCAYLPPAGEVVSRLSFPAARTVRTTLTTSGPALATEPQSYGGRGSYSMANWMAFATPSPAIIPAKVRAMSMPDDTPAL